MKRSVIAAVLCIAALSFASCSSNKSQESSRDYVPAENAVTDTTEAETEEEFHERHDYSDGILIGRWHGYDADIIFQEDGNVSASYDISDVMLFNSDGTFMFDGTEYAKDTVEYDGKTLKVTIDDEGDKVELLALERIGEPDATAQVFDGEYNITSEVVKDMLAEYIGCEDDDIDLRIVIKYGKCSLFAKDFTKYKQSGDTVDFDGETLELGGFSYNMDEPCTFVYEDNILVIYNSEGVFEAFTRYYESKDEPETTEALETSETTETSEDIDEVSESD
ncbi:MAG: hypothetical protein K5979_08715 [Ruminococcus sp.]|nr:hypothetical protein [Ruminococcus sp.]